ncbi:hypothetical protein MPSEU_000718800 [Mayamaea pseudoterrestris]|nr:hypothetical protein MPSEU_000718800 [Mayamaea pseudoterrestris]
MASSSAQTAVAMLIPIDSSRPLASALTAFSQNAPAVGIAWIASSALLTTYSATSFLKYKPDDASLPLNSKRTRTQPETNLNMASRLLAQPFQQMSRPARLTLYRFGGSFALGLLLHPNFYVAQRLSESIHASKAFLLPALLLFAANLSNSIALDRIGIPLTYTSKCAIPLMTVLLTCIIDGPHALPSPLALAALVPIAIGIAAASWSSPTFQLVGFCAALGSTLAQSALNVYSKRAMSRTGVSGPAAQRVMVGIGLVLTIGVTLLQHLIKSFHQAQRRSDEIAGKGFRFSGNLPLVAKHDATPLWLSSLAFTAYHIEYVLSFMFVRLVQPITYGTCDAIRRLTIIVSGKRMFGGAPLTRTNWYGIGLALMGALGYSIATNLK